MSELVEKPNRLSETEYQKMSPQEKETYIKEVLKKTLQLNPHGLTVTQLRDALQYDRRIIEKHLAIMKMTNEVYTVTLGSNVLYIPNHKAMREATSQTRRFGDYEYQVFTLKNRLGDFVVLQQKNIKKDSQDIAGSLQLPLKDFKDYVEYLRKTITDLERRGP
jgi:predicted transcriptional regulator